MGQFRWRVYALSNIFTTLQTTMALRLYRGITFTSLTCVSVGALAIALASAADTPGPVSAGIAVASRASEFVLNDQYGTQHVYRFPRDKISVLFFADYKGSAQLKAWIKPIYARYQDMIALYGVADLTAVPELLQSFVPLAVRAQVQYPVMLDWEGTVSRDYASQQGQTNLFVVNTQGDIVLKVVGPVSATRLRRVLAQIDGLLATRAQ